MKRINLESELIRNSPLLQTYLTPGKVAKSDEYKLDDIGFAFVRKCIEILETRGLEEEVSHPYNT